MQEIPIPPPTFDFWILLFAGCAFIGLFYSVKLFVADRSLTGMDWLLGLYLLLQSVTLLEYVMYWSNLIYRIPAILDISLLFPLLLGPILLIYCNRAFGNSAPLKSYWPHVLPFVILMAFKAPFYVSRPVLKLYHTHDILFGRLFQYYPWIKIGHMGVYCILLFSMVDTQSGVGSMRRWSRWVTGFFGMYAILSATYQVMVEVNVLTLSGDYFVSLASVGTIFFIAWYGKGYSGVAGGQGVFDSLRPGNEANVAIDAAGSAPKKYVNSGLPASVAVKLAEDLEKLMQEEQLYRQNDLKLETLAERLNTNKHFVSQVINEVNKVNFFEYINLKRIEEAKQLLRTRPKIEMNVIEVAYQVGFNNKGTFNAVFKRITGLTPSEFRNLAANQQSQN